MLGKFIECLSTRTKGTTWISSPSALFEWYSFWSWYVGHWYGFLRAKSRLRTRCWRFLFHTVSSLNRYIIWWRRGSCTEPVGCGICEGSIYFLLIYMHTGLSEDATFTWFRWQHMQLVTNSSTVVEADSLRTTRLLDSHKTVMSVFCSIPYYRVPKSHIFRRSSDEIAC